MLIWNEILDNTKSVLEDDGSTTLIYKRLNIVGNGFNYGDAVNDLKFKIIDYTYDYFDDLETYYDDIQKYEHMKLMERIMIQHRLEIY